MKKEWEVERFVDPALAARLIASQFPDLAPVTVQPFGEGWDNTAYLVNGEWVFRFPRRAVAVPWLEREVRWLPWVAPRVPLPVPRPEWIGRPDERFPWPFVGYRLVPGRTADRAGLTEEQRAACAEPLGRFLHALHAVPSQEAVALGAPGDELNRLDAVVRGPHILKRMESLVAHGVVDAEELRRCGRILSETPPVPPAPRVLVHGDFYVRHFLVDPEGRPVGVIDWGDLHLGHPAEDWGIGYGWFPPASREAFWKACGGVDEAARRLARFRALSYASYLLLYAREIRDHDLWRETVRSLRWTLEGS